VLWAGHGQYLSQVLCLWSNTYMSRALKTEVAPKGAAGNPRIRVVYVSTSQVSARSQVNSTTMGYHYLYVYSPYSLL